MDRSDLELVLAIRQLGSLSAAARSLHLAAPVVTKRLAALEADLQLKLFVRTTRRVSATADGDVFCQHAEKLLHGFQAAEAELRERLSEPTGLIRLAATFGFGRLWLGPALAEFQACHPRLQIQLKLTEQLPDLSHDGFDGAIWLWHLSGPRTSEWVSRRLARNQRILVAAPAYLQRYGHPASPEELIHHACLVVRENDDAQNQRHDHWSLQAQQGRNKVVQRIQVQGPLCSNSGELVRDWCLAGRGIMLRSLWDIAPQLASGQLQRVLPLYAMPDADIHWLMPWQARTPRRIRLLVDFLHDRFRSEPWLPTSAH